MSDLDRLPRIANEELIPRAYRALMHAHHCKLSNVGVDTRFEHVGNHVFLRIGSDLHALSTSPLTLEKRRGVAFGGVRQQALEDAQQLGNARAGFRGDET